jgi:hypothetical protein
VEKWTRIISKWSVEELWLDLDLLRQSSRNLTSTPFYGLSTPHAVVQTAVLAPRVSVCTITFGIAVPDTGRPEACTETMHIEYEPEEGGSGGRQSQ